MKYALEYWKEFLISINEKVCILVWAKLIIWIR